MKPSFWPIRVPVPDRNRRGCRHRLDQRGQHLASTVTPFVVGWAKDVTGSFASGLYALAGFALLAAVVTLIALPSDLGGGHWPGVHWPAE